MDEADEEEEGNEGTGKGNEAGEHAVGEGLNVIPTGASLEMPTISLSPPRY